MSENQEMTKGRIVHLCLSCVYVNNFSYQENLLPKYHVQMGYQVSVIASCRSFDANGQPCILSDYNIVRENGYDVIRLPYKLGPFCKILRHYRGLDMWLDKLSPNIIFMHGLTFSDVTVVIKYKKRHPQVRIYADSHTDYINSGLNLLSKYILHPIIWRYYIQKTLPYIEKCYGVTPLRCDFLAQVYGIPPSKISLLRMGVDDDAIPEDKVSIRTRIRTQLQIREDELVVVCGGKLDELKNIHVLLKAIAQLNSVKLILFGVIVPVYYHSIEKLLNNSNVKYVGWANANQVMEYIIASDVACFPGTHSTLWEEAVGLGCPCILKRWNGMEHTNICDNVVWVQGNNVDELVGCIIKFADRTYCRKKRVLALQASLSFLYSKIAVNSIEA